jgi:hypothetical protein
MFVLVHSNSSSAKAELKISTTLCDYITVESISLSYVELTNGLPLVWACDFGGEQDRGRDSLKYTKFPVVSICCQSCKGPSLPPSLPFPLPPLTSPFLRSLPLPLWRALASQKIFLPTDARRWILVNLWHKTQYPNNPDFSPETIHFPLNNCMFVIHNSETSCKRSPTLKV